MTEIEGLLSAIRAGDAAAVSAALDRTPTLVHGRGPGGETPALVACYHRRPALLGLLRARGAALDIFEAAAAGDVRVLGHITAIAPGMAHNHSRDGWTPLHLAAHFGEDAAVDLLLARGADPGARSKNGLRNTALHAGLAGSAGLALVERLLSAGAEVEAADAGGYTALHLAAGRGDLTLVTRLLLRGAVPSPLNGAGQTPAAVARAQGHEPAAQLLETWWGEHARILARREQHVSPWVTLVARDVEFAPGRPPVTYHALGPAEYVVAVARTPEGLVPVVRQYRPAIEQYTWELPAGLVDPGEDPETACRRELLEETGLRADRVVFLGALHPDTGRLDVRQHMYRVDASGPVVGFVPEPGVAVDYLTPEALIEMIRGGAFSQLHHIAALALAGFPAVRSW